MTTDDLRRRAMTVFGECVACSALFGAATAVTGVFVAAIVNGATDVPAVSLYAILVAGFGANVGLIVGIVSGIVACALVRVGEPRLGPRAVARLMPFVGLCITMPPAIAIGAVGNAAWFAGTGAVVAVLTIGGAVVIGRRYLRRATAEVAVAGTPWGG